MGNKITVVIGFLVVGYTILLMVCNRQIVPLNFIFIEPTRAVGEVLLVSILFSFLLGLSASLSAIKNMRNLQKKNAGLIKGMNGLKKELEKMKRDYAFQEKKVCFLEDTIKSEEAPESKPKFKPKPKKSLFPYKLGLKIEKKKF